MKYDMKSALEIYCRSDFPYVCTGKKSMRKDGACECECGNSTVTPDEYREIRGVDPKPRGDL